MAYYERTSGGKQPGIRRIIAEKYPDLVGENAHHLSVSRAAKHLDDEDAFDPKSVHDARQWLLTSIARRQGQPRFRETLLRLYDNRCAISGNSVEMVLEAAHILSYKGPQTNHPTNGLLLRSDLHTLFDLFLLAVDSDTMTVLVSPLLDGSSYSELAGKPIFVPRDNKTRPNKNALNLHRAESGL